MSTAALGVVLCTMQALSFSMQAGRSKTSMPTSAGRM